MSLIASIFAASPPTGYANLEPRHARRVLVGWLLFCALCVGTVVPSSPGRPDLDRGEGDLALYEAEADRIRAGENYYDAAAVELHARNYPAASVFNWRTPLPTWLIGKLPTNWMAAILLDLLAATMLLAAFETMTRKHGWQFPRGLACAVLLVGPLSAGHFGYAFSEIWAGVFIGLSICAYGANRPMSGVALGLVAVFFRELALPYCVLAAALAWWYHRPKELAFWIIGLGGWLVWFGWHWLQVSSRIPPDALEHPGGWVQLGGIPFLVSTAQMNVYLLTLPRWISAVYFSAAILGLAGWRTPMGMRVGMTVGLYAAAYCIAGHDFNSYWGYIISPLYCFGLALLPRSVVDLWRAAALFPSSER